MNLHNCRLKIWIIGAEGMLGRALLKECKERGIPVEGTGRAQADVTLKEDLAALVHKIQPSHIVNCAGYTDVDKAESEYEKALNVNAQGGENIALAAASVCARFIHISTDYVFNGLSTLPYREEDKADPVNAYGKSKWEAEQRIVALCPHACIIRTSWLFGQGGKNFISSLLEGLKTKEQIYAVDDQWGQPTYAPDLAGAILDLLNQKGVFHFANPYGASRFEIAQFAYEEMKRYGENILSCRSVSAVNKQAFPTIAPRPSYSVLNVEKYTAVTGKKPRLWKEALREFLHAAAQL